MNDSIPARPLCKMRGVVPMVVTIGEGRRQWVESPWNVCVEREARHLRAHDEESSHIASPGPGCSGTKLSSVANHPERLQKYGGSGRANFATMWAEHRCSILSHLLVLGRSSSQFLLRHARPIAKGVGTPVRGPRAAARCTYDRRGAWGGYHPGIAVMSRVVAVGSVRLPAIVHSQIDGGNGDPSWGWPEPRIHPRIHVTCSTPGSPKPRRGISH